MTTLPRVRLSWLVWTLLVWLVACRGGTATTPSATTATAIPPSPTPRPSPTWTPSPSPTPEPWSFLLWLPPNTDPAPWQVPLEAWIRQHAPVSPWQVVPTTDPLAFSGPVAGVFAPLPVDLEDATTLARNQPDVPIWVTGTWTQATDPPENLLVLDLSWTRPRYRAFLAGYLAALISANWRVVFLEPQGVPEEMWPAFWAGTRYMCGMCSPPKPPVVRYPVRISVPQVGGWLPACQQARQEFFVEVAYVLGKPDPEALSCLRQAGTRLLGDSLSANPQELDVVLAAPSWEELLTEYGPRFWQGPRGVVVPQITFLVQKVDVLPPGRQQHLELIWQDLIQGFIMVPEQLPAGGAP